MFWPMKNDKLRHAAIHGINFVKDKIDGLCFTMYDGTTVSIIDQASLELSC